MELQLSELQLEALKKVGNIGAAHAASALSEMVMNKVDLQMPGITVVPVDAFLEMISRESNGVNYLLLIEGEIKCLIILHFTAVTSRTLGTFLVTGSTDYDPVTIRENQEMMDSAIKEVSNILVSQAADAFATLLKFRMIPSIPYKINGKLTEANGHNIQDELLPEAILFDAELKVRNLNISPKIYLIPFKTSVDELLERLGVAEP